MNVTLGGLLPEPVATRKSLDALADRACCFVGRDAWEDRDAAIEPAPSRHGGCPIAACDFADVQIDRMLLVLEMLAPGFVRVPLGLELAQFAEHTIGGIDRVRAGAHLAHMHRHAAHLDLEPDHAGIGAHELLVFRLRDQHGIGLVAAQMCHQRAVAGQFFLDNRLHIDRCRRLQPYAAQCIEREQVCRVSGLHVGAAAAV